MIVYCKLSELIADNPRTARISDAHIWHVTVPGFGVYDEFARNLEAKVDHRGVVLGKNSSMSMRERSTTTIAVIGPGDLFGDAQRLPQTVMIADALYDTLQVDRNTYAKYSTPSKQVTHIYGYLLADAEKDSEWAMLISGGGKHWKPMHGAEKSEKAFALFMMVLFVVIMCIYGLWTFAVTTCERFWRRYLGLPKLQPHEEPSYPRFSELSDLL